MSKRFGIVTTYERTVCRASLKGPIVAPTVRPRSGSFSSLSEEPGRTLVPWRRPPAKMSTSPLDVLEKDVYAFEHHRKTTFYAWLATHEFEMLRANDKEKFLVQWISSLPHCENPGSLETTPEASE